jgi:hypothetical protein
MRFLLMSFLFFVSGYATTFAEADSFCDKQELVSAQQSSFVENIILAGKQLNNNQVATIVIQVIAAELALATVGLIVVPQLLYINKKAYSILMPFAAGLFAGIETVRKENKVS